MAASKIRVGVKAKLAPNVEAFAEYEKELRRPRRRREKELGLMSLPPGIRDAERRR